MRRHPPSPSPPRPPPMCLRPAPPKPLPSPTPSSSPSPTSSARSSPPAANPHPPSPARTTPTPSSTPTPSPHSPRPHHAVPTTPPPGLHNLGNTCYLNSVLQVLYHTPSFRNSILEHAPPPPTPDLSANTLFAVDLVSSLRLVFRQLDAAHAAAERAPTPTPPPPAVHILDPPRSPEPILRDGVHFIAPYPVIDLLRDEHRCTEFDARGQQDAHELLRFLLDKVNDCMQLHPKEDEQEHGVEQEDEGEEGDAEQDLPSKQSSETPTTPSTPPESSSPPRHIQPAHDRPATAVSTPVVASSAAHHPDLDRAVTSPLPTLPPPATAHQQLSVRRSRSPSEDDPTEPTDEDVQNPPASKRRRREDPPAPSPVPLYKQAANPGHDSAHQATRTLAQQADHGSRHDAAHNPHDTPSSTTRPAQAGSSDTLASNAKLSNGRVSSPRPRPDDLDVERRPAKRYRRNLVPDLFEGNAVTATRCHECEMQSQRKESFLDVSVPVEVGRSLSWALSTQCAEEQLRGKNKYFCDNCKTYTEAKRWWQVDSLPDVFTVHLKLFAYGACLTGGGKVSVAMPCPIRATLAEWCTSDCPQRDDEYKLTAVIVHEGTGASSGHYYSYICKPEQEEQWYCCDDSYVTAVSEEDVKDRLFVAMKTRRTAYLLFYSNATELQVRSC